MWKTYCIATIAFVAYFQYATAEKAAIVQLRNPDGANNVTGTVTFRKSDNGVINITGQITQLTAGNHGFHIHNLGKIDSGCLGTGAHFNPHNVSHGAPNDTVRHVGDLGNVYADATGTANISFTDDLIDLEGDHSIIGRAVVVHQDADDLGKGGQNDSLTTGHAGARLACGVIGILDEGETSAAPTLLAGGWYRLVIATVASLCLYYSLL
ncbi:hypothetical protein NQ315_003738 [Exocentrus adspersus]|uniref:Superoxide dismutase [Cu-Zn] n=1 Tax=Exocentrus adspersus TaxID=1586481 RepID=A0AAV8VHW2_9CUCU|nr:hypothetical protein NQ315_003738 [Exocentrus adspersus]